MKTGYAFCFLIVFISSVYAQDFPVTLHFKPEYKEFTTLRIAGSFNGWNNADDALVMTDTDGDGEYQLTFNLAPGIDHMYKFVMDANWGLAYSDPDNPRINTADNNNSQLLVKDPMITYLTPRGVNSRGETYIDNSKDGLPIRAVFAFTPGNPIDPAKLVVTIDGTQLNNPSQYYNAQKKEFLYVPNPKLSTGEHTVSVSITSSKGTDAVTSTFIRDPDYVAYSIPVDFYYDQYNTFVDFSQNLTGVSVVGGFNNWNETFNRLQDADKDGLWEGTAVLNPGKHEYKFKLNNLFWVNDPDQPVFGTSADKNNLVAVTADSIPRLKLISPNEGTVFSNDTTFKIKALLRPGIKSAGIDENSINIKFNNITVPHSFDTSTSELSADISIAGEGRHLAEISFNNKEGIEVRHTFAYGVYYSAKGRYLVDAENDEPYAYPQSVPAGSADIQSVKITDTPTHDSLKFVIEMKDITDRTRIGFIVSGTSKNRTTMPLGLDIQTLDWNGKGFFVPIGAPGNAFENVLIENHVMTSSTPGVYSNKVIVVNEDAATTDKFQFTISLAFIDSLLGSWSSNRLFYVFSYLAGEDKSGNSFEPAAALGGSDAEEDPDIYDAAFARSGFWQSRLLKNYIVSGETDGPRLTALDGKGRGIASITAVEISDSLAKFGPDITFLTPAAEYWYPDVTIEGTISDPAITSILFYYNNAVSTKSVSNGKFSIPVKLNEGENIAYIQAEDSRGFKSVSRNLVLTYKPDNMPQVNITASISGRTVTLTANAVSPVNAAMTYTWSSDPNNPATVFVNSTTKEAVVQLPEAEGEYIFNVRIRDAKNNRVNAKILVLAKEGTVTIPDINYHSSWIDNAIVYEIYPRSFSSQGGFSGINEKIPYLKDLGINTIWFMPVFEGPTTHGYEITDYYSLEKDYGTESEFKVMLANLKANNIKVILDYVVNHTSVQHPFMQNVLEYRGHSPWADFYIWEGEPGNSNYKFYFDWSSLPNLNHNLPDVRKYFIDVAKYWVNLYGIDGYRCDVAWGVEERNTQFWQEWRAALKNIKPDVFLQAETGSDNPVFYQKRFDSANDWELRNKIIGALNGSVSISQLHVEALRTYPAHARPFRFIENHDEVRITSTHDTQRSILAHTILFTLNGVPLIYSGGEVGESTRREMINWSDPDNIRPYFKKMIDLRKKYIHNPAIQLISNSDSQNIWSYSSTSGSDVVITAVNFRKDAKTAALDLSALPFDGTSTYYLTDLFDGTVYALSPSQRSSYEISFNPFQAKVFYYGLDSVTVGVNDLADGTLPLEYKLFQNYPNPFNPTCRIKFQITRGERVTLKIYDIMGKEVATLIDEVKNPGTYETEFNATGLSSGVYFYRITSGNFSETKKLMLMK